MVAALAAFLLIGLAVSPFSPISSLASTTPVATVGTGSSATSITTTPTQTPSPTATAQPPTAEALAQALRLPDTAFAPAQIDPQNDRVEENSNADSDIFSTDHSSSFEILGRYSGYYQQATYRPASVSDTAYYQYQASIYGSEEAAKAAWNDGLHTFQEYSGGGVAGCSDTACGTIWGSKTEGDSRIVYFALYVNYCVAEGQGEIPSDIFASAKGGLALMTAIHDAAHQLLAHVCAEPPPAAPLPTPTTQPYPNSIPLPTNIVPIYPSAAAPFVLVPCPVPSKVGIQVSACISDSTPQYGESVTAYGTIANNGVGIPGVPMTATFAYKSGSSICTGVTDLSGTASCTQVVTHAIGVYPVRVTLTFTYNGEAFSAITSFTPH